MEFFDFLVLVFVFWSIHKNCYYALPTNVVPNPITLLWYTLSPLLPIFVISDSIHHRALVTWSKELGLCSSVIEVFSKKNFILKNIYLLCLYFFYFKFSPQAAKPTTLKTCANYCKSKLFTVIAPQQFNWVSITTFYYCTYANVFFCACSFKLRLTLFCRAKILTDTHTNI